MAQNSMTYTGYTLVYGNVTNLTRPINSLRPSDVQVYTSVNSAIIASDNGLSPVRPQAIIWNNAAILSIKP